VPDSPPPAIDFEAAYRGKPPWDIGRPQPAIEALFDAGQVHGRVLDVGCGTGEHALLAASRGLIAEGIDASPTAIGIATGKAVERGLDARFVVGDALDLELPAKRFDCVIDSALFHVFDDADRRRYVESLSRVVAPGGRLYMLCFSDQLPPIACGPRRVSQNEIREAFHTGWRVDAIERSAIEVTIAPGSFIAWLASISRV
jgi:ubiquinone/menaquinone biosynthesis C-methylase UbiE